MFKPLDKRLVPGLALLKHAAPIFGGRTFRSMTRSGSQAAASTAEIYGELMLSFWN